MKHVHKAEVTRYEPFLGPVSGFQNPAAHGNITRVECCACGCERWTNVNGRHEEPGEWGLVVYRLRQN